MFVKQNNSVIRFMRHGNQIASLQFDFGLTWPVVYEIPENAKMNGGAKKDPDSEIMIIPSERAAGMEAREVLGYMRVNPAVGLTVTEASGRRNLHGFNEVNVSKPDPLWKKYLDQFNNPFILLLLASAVISVFMRQFDDAGKTLSYFYISCFLLGMAGRS